MKNEQRVLAYSKATELTEEALIKIAGGTDKEAAKFSRYPTASFPPATLDYTLDW